MAQETKDKRYKELEEFQKVMEVPSTFDEGFRWSSLLGAVFVALLMVPGVIYMGLLAGPINMGPAAQWVTVIMFIEVAKRAHRQLNKSEIFVLFFMAAGAMQLPFSGLLWNQFFIRSEAAVGLGIAADLPRWFAPDPVTAPESYGLRTFMHLDWLPVVAMVVFSTFFSRLSDIILGYGLFRLASDIEKLPFPMAPVGAQGIMAMADDMESRINKSTQESWRWRIFSLGGAIGLTFGTVYLLLPTLSGALTGQSIQIFPIPFSDFTTTTGRYLPAFASGIAWDFTNLLAGMVMPFFGMLGGFIGLTFTLVVNPILFRFGILNSWTYGDNTIDTIFKNNVDFYFSFQIGIAAAIALVGFWQVYRSISRMKQRKEEQTLVVDDITPPKGRGDIRFWVVIFWHTVVTLIYTGVSAGLLYWHHNFNWRPPGNENGPTMVVVVMLILGFVYTPIISYVTARLEGMVGEAVEIPFIREAGLILSGYRGVAVWTIPLPIANYGEMTRGYRQCELTGTKFTSIWKARIILYPIILISSIFFMNFIWSLAEVPSGAYPFTQVMWELRARNQCLMWSATLGEYSMFEEAFNVAYLGIGTLFGVFLFGGMWTIGAPIMLTYGVVRGLGQSMPHVIIPQFIGALIGRFYLSKKCKNVSWRQIIPVLMAGFACGMGLIAMAGVGATFLNKAVISLPF